MTTAETVVLTVLLLVCAAEMATVVWLQRCIRDEWLRLRSSKPLPRMLEPRAAEIIGLQARIDQLEAAERERAKSPVDGDAATSPGRRFRSARPRRNRRVGRS